jgi:hypothetical protein
MTAAATPPQAGHHHGEELGGPWQAVTPACPRRLLRARPQRLKRLARDAKPQPRLLSIKWPAPYQVRKTLERHELLAREKSTLERVQAREDHLGARLKQNGHCKHQCHAALLISASRAGSPRPLDGSQMPGREHLAAAPHHFTNQRLDGWLAQAPRWFADARPGALSRRPAPLY